MPALVYKPSLSLKNKSSDSLVISPSPDISRTSSRASRPQTRKARSRSSDSWVSTAAATPVTPSGSSCSCRPISCGCGGQLMPQQQIGSFFYQAPPQQVPLGLCRGCRRIYASSPLLHNSQAKLNPTAQCYCFHVEISPTFHTVCVAFELDSPVSNVSFHGYLMVLFRPSPPV